MKKLSEMNEHELNEHFAAIMNAVDDAATEDTIGSMVLTFQEGGITQYIASVDPATVPTALRELADRIEHNQGHLPRGLSHCQLALAMTDDKVLAEIAGHLAIASEGNSLSVQPCRCEVPCRMITTGDLSELVRRAREIHAAAQSN